MPWKLMGQTGEPTTYCFANENSIKLPSQYVSFYIKINATLRPHQRSFILQWVVLNTVTHNWSKYRKYVSVEQSAINGMSKSYIQVLKQRKYCRRCDGEIVMAKSWK